MKSFFIKLGIAISILISTTALGALIGVKHIYRPRTVTVENWTSLGKPPVGEINQVFADKEGIVYVEMVGGARYAYQPRKGEWEVISGVVKSDVPSLFCPRLRPPGKVAAEFCRFTGASDQIIVALEDGSVWAYWIRGDDNFRAFKVIVPIYTIIYTSSLGALFGIGIIIILFMLVLWVKTDPNKK